MGKFAGDESLTPWPNFVLQTGTKNVKMMMKRINNYNSWLPEHTAFHGNAEELADYFASENEAALNEPIAFGDIEGFFHSIEQHEYIHDANE